MDGATGVEVVESFTDLIDAVLISRYRAVTREEGQKDVSALRHCCLVAVGGYGRRELAPYSDIDVMVLYQSGGSKVVSTLSQNVFHHLWNLGFQVGHSVRSIPDCLTVAEEDLAVRTSLMEARFLAGDPSVFQDFRTKIRPSVFRQAGDAICPAKIGRAASGLCQIWGNRLFVGTQCEKE